MIGEDESFLILLQENDSLADRREAPRSDKEGFAADFDWEEREVEEKDVILCEEEAEENGWLTEESEHTAGGNEGREIYGGAAETEAVWNPGKNVAFEEQKGATVHLSSGIGSRRMRVSRVAYMHLPCTLCGSTETTVRMFSFPFSVCHLFCYYALEASSSRLFAFHSLWLGVVLGVSMEAD
ncbi:hypothetical protein MUK42_35570 [Musa troglodytarum]|uniref:Uncharacterized protein n=1 Tax=Musa troglodytarum TaxID=320322 RepID=A0A9E7L6Q6_9LILI|nr:hypothetical protein MUK42_35570 [Musa troglodytarum]